eukprot:TRINITY_DN4056_c0_g2_i8.p1 TRINITY_DN4056_c0_g2~~TRINITY_DN4056_c0_g2_i8.p1  ORF type:complete len:102 (+),score=31.91 TRINITY_DN4056_c0_g2_i8:138-443(+)
MCIRDSSESGCREGFVTSALAYYQSRAEDQPDAQVGEDNRDVPIEMDSLASTPDRRMTEGHELSLIHISEPTRLLSISYAVFCLKKKKKLEKRMYNRMPYV